MPVAKAAAKPTVQSVSKPVFDALARAKDKASLKGAKISHTEMLTIAKAMDKAIGDGMKKLSPEDEFNEMPYAVGMAMMQQIKKGDFVSNRDFTKLWNAAVDIASEAPDIGNYAPD
jgi:sialic acid synthase SpsE